MRRKLLLMVKIFTICNGFSYRSQNVSVNSTTGHVQHLKLFEMYETRNLIVVVESSCTKCFIHSYKYIYVVRQITLHVTYNTVRSLF